MPDPSATRVGALETVRQGHDLARGSRDAAAVGALQEALAQLGFPVDIDGAYGPQTSRLVQVVQVARGLRTSGTCDAATLDALEAMIGAVVPVENGPDTGPVPPPAPRGDEPVAGLYRGDRFAGQVALSFDDGPRIGRTDKVLDVLRAQGVPASFYTLGERLVAEPELFRRIDAEGHRIGNHSWDHPDFMKIAVDAVRAQLERHRTERARVLGRDVPAHVRPPYGSPFHSDLRPAADHHAAIGQVLAEHGAALMMWQVDTWDWKYASDPVSVVRRFAKELDARKSGGTVLMHDIHPQGAEALPGVLDVVRQRGFRLVREEALLGTKYGAGVA